MSGLTDHLTRLTNPPGNWREIWIARVRTPRFAIGVALAVVIAFAVYAVMLHNQIKTLNQSVAEKTTTLGEVNKRLAEQSTAMADAKKRADASNAAGAVEVANLKLSVEAFARQAASCEQVKRQLNVAETP